jgi:hypothetical protein
MKASDVLLMVDDALYSKTGKRLNNLQRGVISGVLNHQKYANIAEEFDKSEGHVKDVGYELFKLLSSVFEEPVTKANLESVLERQKNLNVSFGNKVIQSHTISCSNIHFEPSSLDLATLEKFHKLKTEIQKLRDRGFSDEEIVEILEIPLELVNTDE